MAREITAVVGPVLRRPRAMQLIGSGELDPGGAKVIWNVADRPVMHPVSQVQMPPVDDLKPMRRIGTYKGAENRISMYPVSRGEAVTMLELESQLELHHATELSMDPRVTEIFAQPCLLLWRHAEGALVHVPDLAALVDGRLAFYAVKPDDRAAVERARCLFEFVAESLRCGRVDFEVLGSVSKQRQVNVERLARYRQPAPRLEALVEVVRPLRPQSIGGFYRLVCEHLGLGGEFVMPQPGCARLVGLDAALYALAHGWASTDLDEPFQLSTALMWTQHQVRR